MINLGSPDSTSIPDVKRYLDEFLMDKRNHQLQSGEWKGVVRNFYTITYQGYNIWGATAGMIRNLYERIKEID